MSEKNTDNKFYVDVVPYRTAQYGLSSGDHQRLPWDPTA